MDEYGDWTLEQWQNAENTAMPFESAPSYGGADFGSWGLEQWQQGGQTWTPEINTPTMDVPKVLGGIADARVGVPFEETGKANVSAGAQEDVGAGNALQNLAETFLEGNAANLRNAETGVEVVTNATGNELVGQIGGRALGGVMSLLELLGHGAGALNESPVGAVTKPIGQALQWYGEHVNEPVAGLAEIALQSGVAQIPGGEKADIHLEGGTTPTELNGLLRDLLTLPLHGQNVMPTLQRLGEIGRTKHTELREENPVGAFAVELLTDPTNLIPGIGIDKAQKARKALGAIQDVTRVEEGLQDAPILARVWDMFVPLARAGEGELLGLKELGVVEQQGGRLLNPLTAFQKTPRAKAIDFVQHVHDWLLPQAASEGLTRAELSDLLDLAREGARRGELTPELSRMISDKGITNSADFQRAVNGAMGFRRDATLDARWTRAQELFAGLNEWTQTMRPTVTKLRETLLESRPFREAFDESSGLGVNYQGAFRRFTRVLDEYEMGAQGVGARELRAAVGQLNSDLETIGKMELAGAWVDNAAGVAQRGAKLPTELNLAEQILNKVRAYESALLLATNPHYAAQNVISDWTRLVLFGVNPMETTADLTRLFTRAYGTGDMKTILGEVGEALKQVDPRYAPNAALGGNVPSGFRKLPVVKQLSDFNELMNQRARVRAFATGFRRGYKERWKYGVTIPVLPKEVAEMIRVQGGERALKSVIKKIEGVVNADEARAALRGVFPMWEAYADAITPALNKVLAENGLKIQVTDEMLEYLIHHGTGDFVNETLARVMRRAEKEGTDYFDLIWDEEAGAVKRAHTDWRKQAEEFEAEHFGRKQSATPEEAVARAKEAATKQAATPTATPAQVPVLITREMERRLRGLGYRQTDIDKLTPQEARTILIKGERKGTRVEPVVDANGELMGKRNVATKSAQIDITIRPFEERFPLGTQIEFEEIMLGVGAPRRKAGEIIGYQKDPITGEMFARTRIAGGGEQNVGDIDSPRVIGTVESAKGTEEIKEIIEMGSAKQIPDELHAPSPEDLKGVDPNLPRSPFVEDVARGDADVPTPDFDELPPQDLPRVQLTKGQERAREYLLTLKNRDGTLQYTAEQLATWKPDTLERFAGELSSFDDFLRLFESKTGKRAETSGNYFKNLLNAEIKRKAFYDPGVAAIKPFENWNDVRARTHEAYALLRRYNVYPTLQEGEFKVQLRLKMIEDEIPDELQEGVEQIYDALAQTAAKRAGLDVDTWWARNAAGVEGGPTTHNLRDIPQWLDAETVKGATDFLPDMRGLLRFFRGEADASTYIHEAAHLFLPTLDAADMDAAARWMGLENGAHLRALHLRWVKQDSTLGKLPSGKRAPYQFRELGKATSDAERYAIAQEKFARGFERYLAEGIAPTPALERAFESFKNFLLEIYRGITGSEIDVKLTDEMRALYGRMLDAEDVISPSELKRLQDAAVREVRGELAKQGLGNAAHLRVGFFDGFFKRTGESKKIWQYTKAQEGLPYWWYPISNGQNIGTTMRGKRIPPFVAAGGPKKEMLHGTARRDWKLVNGSDNQEWMDFVLESYNQTLYPDGSRALERGDDLLALVEENLAHNAPARILAQRGARKQKKVDARQGDMFDAGSPLENQDLPLFSGTPMQAQESAFVPHVELGTQGKLFDTRPEFGGPKKEEVNPLALEREERINTLLLKRGMNREKAESIVDATDRARALPPQVETYIRELPNNLDALAENELGGRGGILRVSDYPELRNLVPNIEYTGDRFVATRRQVDQLDQVTFNPRPSTSIAETPPLPAQTETGQFMLFQEVAERLKKPDAVADPNLKADLETAIAEQLLRILKPHIAAYMGEVGGRALQPVNHVLIEEYVQLLEPRMTEAKQAAQQIGRWYQNRTVMDYSQRWNVDDAMSFYAPFTFYPLHMAANIGQDFLDKPALFAMYVNAQEELDRQTKDLPQRFAHKLRIPMPFLPDWMGDGIFFDPFATMYPARQVFQLDDLERATMASQRGEPMDAPTLFQEMYAPHIPIKLGMRLLTGDENAVQDTLAGLPFMRIARALTAPSGTGGAGGFAPFESKWDLYYAQRELGNMVGNKEITPEEMRIALLTRKGVLWDEGKKRAGLMNYTLPILGGGVLGFTGKAYSQGEQNYNAARKGRDELEEKLLVELGANPDLTEEQAYEFLKARGEYAGGQETGVRGRLREYLDAHPELERADIFKEDEILYREHLIDLIWAKVRGASELETRIWRAQLGEKFDELFYKRETRNYEALETRALLGWANALGTDIPDVSANPEIEAVLPEAAKVTFPSAEQTRVYAEYRAEVEQAVGWERYFEVNARYWQLEEGQRKEFLKTSEGQLLKTVWDFNREFFRGHPDMQRLLEDSGAMERRDTAKTTNPQGAAFGQGIGVLYASYAEYTTEREAYYALPKGSQARRDYLAEHPRLLRAFELGRAIYGDSGDAQGAKGSENRARVSYRPRRGVNRTWSGRPQNPPYVNVSYRSIWRGFGHAGYVAPKLTRYRYGRAKGWSPRRIMPRGGN